MKKQHLIVAVLAVSAAVLTGCSWDDFKAKIVGNDKETTATGGAVSGSPIEIEDYDVNECITLAEYKGIEVDCSVSDEELQSSIDEYLQSNPLEKKVKKGTCKSGTVVNIDYVGKIDGKEFDGGSQEGSEITIGASGFIDGFDDGLVGMKVGETKDLKLKFPDPYQKNTELSGKDVVFTVKVNYIIELSEAKLTDAYVKSTSNSEYETVAEFKKAKKEDLQKQKEDNYGTTALSKVIENSTVNKMPATLKEAQRQQQDFMNRATIKAQYGESVSFDMVMGQYGMTLDDYNKMLDTNAENSAKVQMIIEMIAAKEGIEATDEAVQAYIKQNIEAASVTEEEYREAYADYYGPAVPFDDFIKTSYLYNKVSELVKEKAVVKNASSKSKK